MEIADQADHFGLVERHCWTHRRHDAAAEDDDLARDQGRTNTSKAKGVVDEAVAYRSRLRLESAQGR
jgi:hypothetical protein